METPPLPNDESSTNYTKISIDGASYQQLLEIVTVLQNELEKTVSISMDLKRENAKLRKDFDEIKESKARMVNRFEESRDALLQQAEDVSERSRELDKSEGKWKARLQCQADEIREIRQALILSKKADDNLKQELTEKFEAENGMKCHELEMEVKNKMLMICH